MSNSKNSNKQKSVADEFYQTSLDKLIEADYEKISYLMNLYDHDQLILNDLVEFADEFEEVTGILDRKNGYRY